MNLPPKFSFTSAHATTVSATGAALCLALGLGVEGLRVGAAEEVSEPGEHCYGVVV